MSRDHDVLEALNEEQEHYLKKYVLEDILLRELGELSRPDCCELIGDPFIVTSKEKGTEIPLVRFFFQNFIRRFPLIAINNKEDQRKLWQDIVQPFVESFNLKGMSNSTERSSEASKRRKANKKLLSGLLVFYNSMLVTRRDLQYIKDTSSITKDHGNARNLFIGKSKVSGVNTHCDNFAAMSFTNGLSIGIVAVRRIEGLVTAKKWHSFITSPTPIKRHQFEFIVQAVSQREKTYENNFVRRTYGDFKKLESDLKKVLPGLMSAKVPKLPKRAKHDKGIEEGAEISDEYMKLMRIDSTDTNLTLDSEDPNISNRILFKEKLRLSLRGYLHELIKHEDIINSPLFQRFLFDPKYSVELTEADWEDHRQRTEHETQSLKTQQKFQEETSKVILKLYDEIKDFRHELVMNPGTLSAIFQAIKKSPDAKRSSPILMAFGEWCKIEVASAMYLMFLAEDSSDALLDKCIKFHRFFPYLMVYGILRFTNPAKMLSKMLDLLFINIPSATFWQAKDPKQSRCLMSMVFVMLLDEDLGEFEKEFSVLEAKLKEYPECLEKLANYASSTYDVHELVIDESVSNKESLLVAILSNKRIEPEIPYQHLQSIKDSCSNSEKEQLYLNLKQYMHLKIRQHDKKLLKQLWLEPELVNLIKEVIKVFYKPIMELLSRANVHEVFRDFHRFVNEALSLFSTLNRGQVYSLSPGMILNKIMMLLNNFEPTFWNFIHNVYIHDDKDIFGGIVEWINKFLLALRFKFNQVHSVTFALETDELIDRDLFLKQLNGRIELVTQRRKLFREYLEKMSGQNEKQDLEDTSGFEIDFGIVGSDIEEFNNINSEDNLDKNDPQNDQMVFRGALHELEQKSSQYGTSELRKFVGGVEPQLKMLLANIDLNR